MYFTLEPGYYEDGNFGIRLETAVVVVNANTPVSHLLDTFSKAWLHYQVQFISHYLAKILHWKRYSCIMYIRYKDIKKF